MSNLRVFVVVALQKASQATIATSYYQFLEEILPVHETSKVLDPIQSKFSNLSKARRRSRKKLSWSS
jgi:hypothetical protein